MTEPTRGARRPDRTLTATEQANLGRVAAAAGEVALLFPTETGLKKSIFDATESVRALLKVAGVHDYESQAQGQGSKVILPVQVLLPDRIADSSLSLYRPETKHGDPRLWIRGAPQWSRPGDVLAIFTSGTRVFVGNLSDLTLEVRQEGAREVPVANVSAEAIGLLDGVRATRGRVADELLNKLRAIAARGPVAAQGHGDTAVGRTLEFLLDIAPNPRPEPDYKGIEIKAKRLSSNRIRQTLFAQVPDWSISRCKSSAEILDRFGYDRAGLKRLNCTVRLGIPNSQGLFLALQRSPRVLEECHSGDMIAVWAIDTLERRLLDKHRETFWVSATSHFQEGIEYFSFNSIQHTRAPSVALFNQALGEGEISVDHLIKRVGMRVSERGPLFKLSPDGIPLLFPTKPEFHDLTAG